MGKTMKVLGLLGVLSVFVSQSVSAQMINYNRGKGQTTTSARPAARARASQTNVPQWARVAPEVKTWGERRYDRNRDGRLEQAEVKAFLRNVVNEVARRGAYQIDTDFLREYDKNNDGYISRYEAQAVERDISS